jgi:hypothetical protein
MESKTRLKQGVRVVIKKSHPWGTHAGTLVAYENYGPSVFKWSGWKVRLDEPFGQECYAKSELQVVE